MTKPKERLIDAIKLIRWASDLGLLETKQALDDHSPFRVSSRDWPEFKDKADALGAEVTTNENLEDEKQPTINDVMTELHRMSRDLEGLREHLGLRRHE